MKRTVGNYHMRLLHKTCHFSHEVSKWRFESDDVCPVCGELVPAYRNSVAGEWVVISMRFHTIKKGFSKTRYLEDSKGNRYEVKGFAKKA